MYNYIGIIDSGIGGLTVLKNLMNILPNENYIYVGDNKNCPYGNKTSKQLLEYTSNIIDYFITRGVKLVAIACNTISSNILPILIEKYKPLKIIGVIESTIRAVVESNSKNCLVIATSKTIESHIYEKEIKSINLFSKATPMLASLIEKNDAQIINYLHHYLDEFKNKIDTIVLGCTHYPIIEDKIKEVLGNVNIISSSEGIAGEIKEYLTDINNLNSVQESIEIYTTGDSNLFYNASKDFFKYKSDVKHLSL